MKLIFQDLTMFSDIEFDNSPVLFEDFLDDFDVRDNQPAKSRQLVDEIDDEREPFDRTKYKHYIDIAGRVGLAYESKYIPFKVVCRAIHNLIEEYVVPAVENIHHIEDYRIGWYFMNETFYDVDQTYEFMKQNVKPDNNDVVYFMVYFNTPDNMTLRQIVRLLLDLWTVKRKYKTHLSTFITPGDMLVDGWHQYPFDDEVYKAFKMGDCGTSKVERLVRHFVHLFDGTKAIKKQLSQEYNYKVFKGYLGTGLQEWQFHHVFKYQDDWRDRRIERCRDPKNPKGLLIRIPEDKSVWIQTMRASNVLFRLLTDGEVIFWNRLEPSNMYGLSYNDFGLERLDADYEHNKVTVFIEYQTIPRDNVLTLNFNGRHIRELTIKTDSVYIEDVAHLQDVVRVVGDENVSGNIKWIVDED